MRRTRWYLGASAAFAMLLWVASPASAQSPGAAQTFAVLGGTTVTRRPGTVIRATWVCHPEPRSRLSGVGGRRPALWDTR